MLRKKPKQAEFEIAPDTKLLLVIETKSGAEGITNRLSLGSYVEEVISADCFLMQMPVYRGYNYPLSRDEPILMYLLSKSRMYSMTAIFVERVRHDGLLFAKMRKCSPVKPGQRRDCYRLPCELPVLVEVFPTTNYKAKTEPPIPHECQMIDFSDGGMLFATKEAFAIGEKVRLAFGIGTNEAITAEVLRCERLERSEQIEIEPSVTTSNEMANPYRHKTAVKFINKCKKQQNRFYRFIVEQQRLKMRLLAEQEALNHNGQGGDFHAKTKQA